MSSIPYILTLQTVYMSVVVLRIQNRHLKFVELKRYKWDPIQHWLRFKFLPFRIFSFLTISKLLTSSQIFSRFRYYSIFFEMPIFFNFCYRILFLADIYKVHFLQLLFSAISSNMSNLVASVTFTSFSVDSENFFWFLFG